jgi:hypothetical protein
LDLRQLRLDQLGLWGLFQLVLWGQIHPASRWHL